MTIYVIKIKRAASDVVKTVLLSQLEHTVDSPLEEGLVLTIDELAAAARSVREQAGDRQEDTAAKLDVGQAQISRAENGSKSHSSTCIEMIHLYTPYRVEHPLFRITRAEE